MFPQSVFAVLYPVDKALVSYLLGIPVKVNFLADVENADAYDDAVRYYRWKSIGK